ncbi:MAG TPA: PIN domain nuclease [Thermoanaerobaculia bacterium]|nr:PIN domain nuclease [Thermoanaerobaculia bacterium]
MKPRFVVDKSALARMALAPVRSRLEPIIEAGEAATCAIIDLEVLYSARNDQEYRKILRRRELAYASVEISEQTLRRAIQIQEELARRGQHRIPIPDLIIAAAAESGGLIVLHYDADFDRIARVTGQPMEWVVKRGSV